MNSSLLNVFLVSQSSIAMTINLTGAEINVKQILRSRVEKISKHV